MLKVKYWYRYKYFIIFYFNKMILWIWCINNVKCLKWNNVYKIVYMICKIIDIIKINIDVK